MIVFRCSNCQNRTFFENSSCTYCGALLAYVAAENKMLALAPHEDGWHLLEEGVRDNLTYKLCQNYSEHEICNWAFAADLDHDYCQSCELTTVIPNLNSSENIENWFKLEQAKRRLVYSLIALNLPMLSKAQDPKKGLSFEFLADDDAPEPVLTGHAQGVVTINLAEADDVERERRKQAMGEPYRTLVGHVRHEVGHYYWDRLIKNTHYLTGFRQIFGDEREDYAASLRRHYDAPKTQWQGAYISAYATAHPWEDWAESWAHYLHMVTSLDTARSSGLNFAAQSDTPTFEGLTKAWFALTYLLNNINRSLGLEDPYPFILGDDVLTKLEFVHGVVHNVVSEQG